MTDINDAVNAGVNAVNGFEFQKHCALYILFEKYHLLKSQPYFICLEHHDDFVICQIADNGKVNSIQAYQAKKSTTKWGMSQELYELISKVVNVGIKLGHDTIPKESLYSHQLHFLSNYEIKLHNEQKAPNRKSVSINVSNNELEFVSLDNTISDRIQSELKSSFQCDQAEIDELDKLSFKYIDLPQSNSKQKSTLIGEFGNLFGQAVSDHKAAIDTLLLLFRDVENTLNNGSVTKLMDESKRVTSAEINQAINIITTQRKAYDQYRSQPDLSNSIGIPVLRRNRFQQSFLNSFDLFKDNRQLEHKNIYMYVHNNIPLITNSTSDSECVLILFNSFKTNQATKFDDVDLKATIYAAFIELLEDSK